MASLRPTRHNHLSICCATRLLYVLCGLLLLPTIAHAQDPGASATTSNIVMGLPTWKAVLFAPDPAWRTGSDGIQDQWCQTNNATWNTPWAGMQNQIVWSCFGVPNPTTGAWNASFRLRGYTGHLSNTWFNGYDIGLEGQRLNGVETVDRFFIYRFVDDQTILSVSQPYPQVLVLGQVDKPMHFWVSGMVDVPKNYIRAQGLILYPLSLPLCDVSNAGRFNYASGAPGVRTAHNNLCQGQQQCVCLAHDLLRLLG